VRLVFSYAARVAILNGGVQPDVENGSGEDGISSSAQEQGSLIAVVAP
jgi:hypothetical protein